jgi:hypothetical protein
MQNNFSLDDLEVEVAPAGLGVAELLDGPRFIGRLF